MAETAKTLQLPSSSDRTRFPPNFYRIGSAIVVLVIWEIAGRASDSLSIPTLGATVGAWVELMVSGRLPMALLISGIAMAVGLLMSILVGCAVGLAIGWVKYLE
ncbi:MAG: hypothetical protein HYY09_04890, partial [Firmicutes bacterium]|nr:hypothetical protein [Bacillota bacterium]